MLPFSEFIRSMEKKELNYINKRERLEVYAVWNMLPPLLFRGVVSSKLDSNIDNERSN